MFSTLNAVSSEKNPVDLEILFSDLQQDSRLKAEDIKTAANNKARMCLALQTLPMALVEAHATKRHVDPKSVRVVRKELRWLDDVHPLCLVTVYSSAGVCTYNLMFGGQPLMPTNLFTLDEKC